MQLFKLVNPITCAEKCSNMRNIEPETKTIVDDASHLVLKFKQHHHAQHSRFNRHNPSKLPFHTHNDVTSYLRTDAQPIPLDMVVFL